MRINPRTWDVPATGVNAEDFDEVEIQIVGVPAVAYTPQRSLDGANWEDCNVYDKDGAAVASIVAEGIYSMDGGGHCRLAAGNGSTVTYRAA